MSMKTEVLMQHKEFTGAFSGHGWRATLKDWPAGTSPGALSIAIYDATKKYLYSPGAFQFDGAWYLETPPGQLVPTRQPIYWRVLEGATEIGEAVLPTDLPSVVVTAETIVPKGYDALADELNTDPLGLGYSSMTDEEATAEINKPQFSSLAPFNVTGANRYFTVTDKMRGIENSPLESAKDWMTITRYFMPGGSLNGDSLLNASELNYVKNTLNQMVDDSLITEVDKDNVFAYTEQTRTRGQEIEVGFVTAGEVGYSRSLI